MSYGVFLGYKFAPGGRWNGEYLVADLDTFVDMPLDIYAPETKWWLQPHITEQVKLGRRGICFPLKPKYDSVNETYRGREASNADRYDEFGVLVASARFTADNAETEKNAEKTDAEADAKTTDPKENGKDVEAAESEAKVEEEEA